MARSRFVGDAGLTARMTLVMFLLGGLFVALVVGLALAIGQSFGPGLAIVVGLVGIGVAVYQWA
ncbi:MAG: zinc metalloprotease HtpX, partial [Nocardioides sp.]